MLPLIFTLERGSRLCEFTAHWRVRNAAELMLYLQLLIALCLAFCESTEAA